MSKEKVAKVKKTRPAFAYTVVNADGIFEDAAWDNAHDMDAGAPFQVDLSGPYPRTVSVGQGLPILGRAWCAICQKWAAKGHPKLHPEKYIKRVSLYPSPKQAMFWSKGKGWPVRLLKVKAPGYVVLGKYSEDEMSITSNSSKIRAIEVVGEVALEEGLGKYAQRLSWLFQKALRTKWWTQTVSEEAAKKLVGLFLKRWGLRARPVRFVKLRRSKSFKKEIEVEDKAYAEVRNRFWDQMNKISKKRNLEQTASSLAHYIGQDALLEPEVPTEDLKPKPRVRVDLINTLLLYFADCAVWCATSSKPCPHEPLLELARAGYTVRIVSTKEVVVTRWPKRKRD